MNCQVPHCPRPIDDEGCCFKGKGVCAVHERRHWKSKGNYIWNKLGLLKDMRQKELQVRLS